MTHMSREFSLVLVGAGLLTAGFYSWPEPDFEKRAEEQAGRRVGSRTGGHLIFIGHIGGGSYSTTGTGRSPAFASVGKGGLGSIGGRVASGGG